MNALKRLIILLVLLSVSACAHQGYYRSYETPVIVETGRSVRYVEPAYPAYGYRSTTVINKIDYGRGKSYPHYQPASKVYPKPQARNQHPVKQHDRPAPVRRADEGRWSSKANYAGPHGSEPDPRWQAYHGKRETNNPRQATHSDKRDRDSVKNRGTARDSVEAEQRREGGQRQRADATGRQWDASRDSGSRYAGANERTRH